MSKARHRLDEYLSHILKAIEKIQHYTRDMTEDQFAEEELVQDAVIRNFEIIGEAGNNILKHHSEFAERHPEIQFRDAYEMRNFLSHAYFSVDTAIVWKSIHVSLPVLEQHIKETLDEIEDNFSEDPT